MKSYAKKFNAQRAAKAAGHYLAQFEVVKTKDRFTWREKKQPEARCHLRCEALAQSVAGVASEG